LTTNQLSYQGNATQQASLPKVTGSARYASDIGIKDSLVGVVLRAPFPHAKILRVGASKARQSPGVRAIVTAEDIPGVNIVTRQVLDQPILAHDKVRSTLDALALVAADTLEQAQAALRVIDVDLEPLPAVFSAEEALAPGAPQVHESGNLLNEYHLSRGDIHLGFAQADVIVEGSYSLPPIDHSYLEPIAGAAQPLENGGVRIWYGCNSVFVERAIVAKTLDLPLDKVEIIHPYTGGVFGGRNEGLVPSFLALLALKSGRPVRMTFSRQELFTGTAKRHPQEIRVRTCATLDGRLTAAAYEIVSETGAYAHWGPSILLFCSIGAPGPYRIPNLQVDTKVVYTNNVTKGSMRGWGTPAVTFATESQMEMLAVKLGMHPLVLRWFNAYEDGDELITGSILPGGVRLKETIAAAALDLGIKLPE
jgi:nicotinate dehydrogenase large molybdopterin subunit